MLGLEGYASSSEEEYGVQASHRLGQSKPLPPAQHDIDTNINRRNAVKHKAAPQATTQLIDAVDTVSPDKPDPGITRSFGGFPGNLQVAGDFEASRARTGISHPHVNGLKGAKHAEDGSPTLSPYSRRRQLVQSLTLPPIPTIAIPQSPPETPDPGTTAKIQRFLILKEQGVHFNQKLASNSSLLNPRVLTNLAAFAGIDDDAIWADAQSEDLAVGGSDNSSFDGWAYAEFINDEIQARMKTRKVGREAVVFSQASNVAASSKA